LEAIINVYFCNEKIYIFMKLQRLFSFSTLLFATVSSGYSQCIVAGTEFDTKTELCNPTMESDTNEVNGWFNSNVADILAKQCGNRNFIRHPSDIILNGLPSNKFSVVGNASLTWNDLLKLKTPNSSDTGMVVVTANPKLISPYLSEGNGTPMLVAMGNGHGYPFLSYSVTGLSPNSTVTMSADVYDLLDLSELETALKAMNSGVVASTDYKTKIPLPYGGSYEVQLNAGKLDYSQGRINGLINNQFSIIAATTNNNGMAPTGMGAASVTPTNGGKQLKISAKADNSGSVTFYFWRNAGGNARPIGLDNIVIEGEILPEIKVSGVQCPMNPSTLRLNSKYPAGTTYSWNVAETSSQTSNNPTFLFIPGNAGKYNVTCEVTIPGCKTAKSNTFSFETGNNCCESADGTPLSTVIIYKNDFGQFVGSNFVYSDAKGNDYSVPVTDNTYCSNGHVTQVIKNQLDNSINVTYNKDFCSRTDAYAIITEDPYSGSGGDHTGNSNGGMLIMDLKSEGWKNKAIFKKEIKGVCKGTNVYFSTAVQAINDLTVMPGSPTSIGTLELVLKSASGSVLASSGEQILTKPGWVELSANVMLTSDETSVSLELISLEDDYTGDGRGDFAVDDITLQVCAPPAVEITSNLSGEELLNLCSDKEFILKAVTSEAVKNYYKDVNYLFQWTKDDPTVVEEPEWHDLGSPSTDDSYTFANPVNEEPFLAGANYPETNFFFRLVVGNKETLISERNVWEDMNAQTPCRNVSISSIPVIASLNCPVCVEPDEVVIMMKGDGKTGSRGNVLYLCPGEEVAFEVGKIIGTDVDSKPYYNYVASWHKDDIKSTPLMKKVCSDADNQGPALTITYDNVIDGGANEAKYILLIHDNNDPSASSTPCDHADTITVIANPKPMQMLMDPDPFCEGTLAQEPDKKISGYEISWYEDADTLTGTEEPVISGVTMAESPKSYYYVLTDSKTGCRGESNEYKIEVNKADANAVDNSKKIEYRKADAKSGSLKALDIQSGSTFRAALSMSDYSLHIGLVEGATEATAPDMSTAKFGSASTTIPAPTVKDVDSSDDEYLWYYTYMESAEGCLSDTVLVGVVIKGAPSPTPKDAAYCVNSGDVKPMSEYATPASEDPAGELVFYGPNKTTRMDPSDLPDVSIPGRYTYYVSQISSTGGGESTKQPIVIEVYGVNDVVLSEASDKYCKNEKNTKSVEDIASVKPSTDDYVQYSGWEFFEANEPVLNEKTAGAESSMKVATSTAGEYKHYVRLKYEVPKSTEVCYGKHVEYTVEIQSVEDPITGVITYLKTEGLNGFKKPTEQNPDAVIGDADCADCSIVWYDVNKNKIDESDATPKYDESLQGNEGHTYYVKQVNKLGCESDFKPVSIIVSAYPSSLENISNKKVSIAPNPASTKISVIAEEVVEKVEILNMVGEVVKVSNRKDIDTSTLSNGVYFVRTTINDETTVHKLVINK